MRSRDWLCLAATATAAAAQLGWPIDVIPAEWARYGVAAGPIRNGQMLRRACELAIALQLQEQRKALSPGHRDAFSRAFRTAFGCLLPPPQWRS